MKFSLLCLSALVASTSAFVLPTQRPAAVAGSSATQLQVAAEVINGEAKPRRTRQVCDTGWNQFVVLLLSV